MKERSASKAFFRRRQKEVSSTDAAESHDAPVDVTVHHNDLISSTSTSWFASSQMAADAKHKRASWSAFPQYMEEQQCGSAHGSSPCTPMDTRKSLQFRSRSFSIENLENSVGGSNENLKKSKRKGGFGSMRFTPSFLRGSASSIKELFSGIGGKNRGSSDSLHQSGVPQPLQQARRNSLGNQQQPIGKLLGTPGLRDPSQSLAIAFNAGTSDTGHAVDGCCLLCGNDASLHSTIGCRRVRGTNMAPSSRVDTRDGNLSIRCSELAEEVTVRKWADYADGGGCRNSGVFTVLEEDENETSFERMTDSNDMTLNGPKYENISDNKVSKAPPPRDGTREHPRAARVLFAQPKLDVGRSSMMNGHSASVRSGASSSKMLLDARLSDPQSNRLPHNDGGVRRTSTDVEPQVRGFDPNLVSHSGPASDVRFTAPFIPDGMIPNSTNNVLPQCANQNNIHNCSSGGFVPNPIYLNDYPVVRDRSNSVAVGCRDGHRLVNGADEFAPMPWQPSSSRLEPGTRNRCQKSGGSCYDIRIGSNAFPAANCPSNAREKTSAFFGKENVVPELKQSKKLSKSSSFKQSFSFMNAKSFFPKLDSKKKPEKSSSSKMKLSESSKDSFSISGEKSIDEPSSSARCSATTFEDCEDNGFSSFVNDIRRRSLRCSAAVDFIRTPSKRSLFSRGPLRSSAKSASHSHHSNTSSATDQLSFYSVDHSNSSTKLDTSFSYLAFSKRRFNKLNESSRSTQSAPAYGVSLGKNGAEVNRDCDRWQHDSIVERPHDISRFGDSAFQRDVGNCSALTTEPTNQFSRCYENVSCSAANGYVVSSHDRRDSENATGLSANVGCSFNLPEDVCCETISPVVDKPTKVTPIKANKRKKRRTKKKQKYPEKIRLNPSQAPSNQHPNVIQNSKIVEVEAVPCGNSACVASDCVDGQEDFFRGLQDRKTSDHNKVDSRSSSENSKQSHLLLIAQHPQGLAPASDVVHSWSTHPVIGHPPRNQSHPPLQAAASAPAQYCCGASPCCPHTWVPNAACLGDGMTASVAPECCTDSSPMDHTYRNCQMNCCRNPVENFPNLGSYPLPRVTPAVGFERSLSSPGNFQAQSWTSGAHLGVNSYSSSGNVGSSIKYPIPARPIPVPEEPDEGILLPKVMSGLPVGASGVRQLPATPSTAVTRLHHQNNLSIELPKGPLSPCLSSASYASPSFFRDTFPEPQLNEEYSAPLDRTVSSKANHHKTETREACVVYMQPLNPGMQEVTELGGKIRSKFQSPKTDYGKNKSQDGSGISVREKRSTKKSKAKAKVTDDQINSIGALRDRSSSEGRFCNYVNNSETRDEASGSHATVNAVNRIPRSSWNHRRESIEICTQKSSPLSSNFRSLSCQSINRSCSSIEHSSRSINESNQSIHRTAQRNFMSGSSCQSLTQSGGCKSSSSLASCLSEASCESEVHSVHRAVESSNGRRSESIERSSQSSSVLGLAELYNSNKDLSPSFTSGNCIANSQCIGSSTISQMSVKSRSSKLKKALMETGRPPCPFNKDTKEPFYENHGSLSVNRFFFDEHVRPDTAANRFQTTPANQSSAGDVKSDVQEGKRSITCLMPLQRVGASNIESSSTAHSDSTSRTRHDSEKVDRSLYSFFPMAHCSTFPGTDNQFDDRISEVYFRPGGRHSKPFNMQTNSALQLSTQQTGFVKNLRLEEMPKSSEILPATSHGLKSSNEKMTPALPLCESVPPPLPPPLPRSVLDAVARLPYSSSKHTSSSLPARPSCPPTHGIAEHSASYPYIPPRAPRINCPLDSVAPLLSPSPSSSQECSLTSPSSEQLPSCSTNNIQVSSSPARHSDCASPCPSMQFESLPPSLRQPKSPQDHNFKLGKSKSCDDTSSSSPCHGELRLPLASSSGSETTQTNPTMSGVASSSADDAAQQNVCASSSAHASSTLTPHSSSDGGPHSDVAEILCENGETSGRRDSPSSSSLLLCQNSENESVAARSAVFTNQEQFQRLKSDLEGRRAVQAVMRRCAGRRSMGGVRLHPVRCEAEEEAVEEEQTHTKAVLASGGNEKYESNEILFL
ncbi:hypothetical protein FHG87_019092 [Trinorchestia longiramus]|nr:hypothetical protein FHG87_019092 [Trinorchestia longiramus]